MRAEGHTYRLHAERPGPALNLRACVTASGIEWRSALDLNGAGLVTEEQAGPALTRVDVRGPLEQRAGYHDPCGGYSDGHDALCERFCAACEVGDVLMVMDCPGSVVAGAEQNIARAVAAKAKYGRRVTLLADELCASGGLWWGASLADEIFLSSPRSQIGSIGARGGHQDISGALDQAGVVFTYFTWPNAGKVALAPEMPLSKEGKARGERDINAIGEAFCAAVVNSTIGKRNGLTREAIVALGADVLTGQAAVDAGLADGIASLEEVTEYALALASSGGVGGRIMDDEKDDMDEGEEAKAAKAAKKVEEKEEKDPDSKKNPFAKAAPKAMSGNASLASIVGATSETPLAIKTAAIKMRHTLDRISATLVGVTGKSDTDEQIGALLAFPERIAKGEQAIKDQRAAAKKAEATERASLIKRGIATGSAQMTAGLVYIPKVNDAGERIGTDVAPVFAEMKIGTLRGMVEGLEASATVRNPFEPDESKAKAASEAASGSPIGPDGKPTEAAIEKAKSNPVVQRIFNAPGNTHPIEKIAAQVILSAAGGAS